MKTLRQILFLSLLSFLSMHYAIGGEGVVIIVNSENSQSLTEQQVKNIYSDIVTHWDNGNRIEVLNLAVEEPARESFSKKIFGESARQLAAAEANRKITNTIKNPTKTKSIRLVAKLVSRNPDAIGYIPASMLKDLPNVRVVLQID